MIKTSFPKEKIKILLLENIHHNALNLFKENGYENITLLSDSFSDKELIEKAKNTHILGIRSKTNISKNVLSNLDKLMSIGCFCIGTNQVDLTAASEFGIPVFNAPFSNTRSVAELTIAEIIMLARKIPTSFLDISKGIWNKSANNSYEVRGKKLGIVGYGHIGRQVGVLAENLGMKVYFYDIEPRLSMGNIESMPSLEELAKISDFLTVHVPETEETKDLINKDIFNIMKDGSYLLNLSRGTVVNIKDLAAALKSKKLLGAGIDVYPKEPKGKVTNFKSELLGLENVLLTPHIGGSTQEAQANIGMEVANSIIDYLDKGLVNLSVNIPTISLPFKNNVHRIINIHKNVPGVLSKINQIIADLKVNINSQSLVTNNEIGYLLMDVNSNISSDIKSEIENLEESIKTRVLY